MTTLSGVTPSKVEGSILQTIKYSNHFSFPLTLGEIHLRFVGASPCARPSIIRQIRLMLKTGSIAQTGDYYHLPGRSSLVARRLSRAKISAPQLSRARVLSSRISRLKSILAIYLTGSLAMNNSSGDSDIDLMIITQNNRLWTTRLFLTLYTSILRLRRTPHSTSNSGKLCLNLYLTPTSYLLPPDRRSLYTAYELIQAVPLYDPRNTRAALLASNPWITQFLPNYPLPVPAGPGPVGPGNLPTEPGPIGTLLESLCYHLQLWYMRPKLTRELITPHSAFFHPNNPAPKV